MNLDFNQLKQIILPYFIKIYGEEYKDIIIERMNKIEPIFYNTIEQQKNKMYGDESKKRVELTLKFLENNNIFLPDELKNQIMKDNMTFRLGGIPEADNLLKACFNGTSYRENVFGGIMDLSKEPTNGNVVHSNVEILRRLGFSVSVEKYNDWLSTDEARYAFQKIEKLKASMAELDREFFEFDRQFDELKILIHQSEEIKRKLTEKYMLEFLQSIGKYTTEKDKKLIEEYIHSDKKDWYSFKRQLNIFQVIGHTFVENGLMDAFSSKAEEKLHNPNTSQYGRQSILKDRITYYQLIGLYQNQMPFEEFLESKEAKENAPTKEYMDDILSKKEYFGKMCDEEFLNIASSYQENIKQIANLNLATDFDFSIDNVKQGIRCINPNVRIVNNQPEAVALLFFSLEVCFQGYIDVNLIHEINHAIELSLLEYKDGVEVYKCGFEILTGEKNKIRNYEAFSETLNQEIAMEITEAMHHDGVYLFDNPTTAKTRGSTSYEHQRNFVTGFWTNFRKEIISARVGSSLEPLFSIVGEENFNQINSIIHEYKSLPYYQMMDDVINNRTTELTEKRMNLLRQTQMICEVMVEHANQSSLFEEPLLKAM